MLFKNIPGHRNTKKYLLGLIETQMVPHAMLLTGPAGCGKLEMALAFAARLQCQNPQGIEICGQCSDCLKSHKWIHPDIHIAFPVIKLDKKKREDTTAKDFMADFRSFVVERSFEGYASWIQHIQADNKQANINRTECQQIIRTLSLQRYEGKYKIQIIWMADKLGKEGNRLLKLIEEPTPNTIIILIADSSKSLLNTIVSRCQQVHIPPFMDEDVLLYLEGMELAAERKEEIVRLSFGNLAEAITMSKEEDNDWDEFLLQIMRASYSLSADKIKEEVANIVGFGKQNVISFCEYALHFFREYQKALRLNSTDICRLSPKEKLTVQKMMKVINLTMLEELVKLFETNIGMIRRNVNSNILWTNSLYCIGRQMRKNKIAA